MDCESFGSGNRRHLFVLSSDMLSEHQEASASVADLIAMNQSSPQASCFVFQKLMDTRFGLEVVKRGPPPKF